MTLDCGTVTQLLQHLNEGDAGAWETLWRQVHAQLRGVALRRLQRIYGPDCAGVTLQPTEVAHEAYLRLRKQNNPFRNAGHFFAIATRMIVYVVLDHQKLRHNGEAWTTSLQADLQAPREVEPATTTTASRLARVAVRLEELKDAHPSWWEVFMLRALMELTIEEAAEALQVGHATVERNYRYAREWLKAHLSEQPC